MSSISPSSGPQNRPTEPLLPNQKVNDTPVTRAFKKIISKAKANPVYTTFFARSFADLKATLLQRAKKINAFIRNVFNGAKNEFIQNATHSIEKIFKSYIHTAAKGSPPNNIKAHLFFTLIFTDPPYLSTIET